MIDKVDLFVPIYAVNWKNFEDNIQSWIRELPIRKAYVGCANPDPIQFNRIKKCIEKYEGFEFYDQRHYKTAGPCFADLIKKVRTKWFVYVHSDAWLTPYSFLVLKAEAENNEKAGIIESERVQLTLKNQEFPTEYCHYYYYDRGFSGYQLVRKEAIIDLVKKIEDDYLSNSEDVCFQNACEIKGFEYVKSFAMHIHRISKLNLRRTPQHEALPKEEELKLTYDMNIRAIVKYCTPTEPALNAFINSFTNAYGYGCVLLDFIVNFVRKVNPVWEEPILERIKEIDFFNEMDKYYADIKQERLVSIDRT